tara:strand:+ start:79 stop:831 length:753 start_codon:yes stop_codon:yes gene_type:complete
MNYKFLIYAFLSLVLYNCELSTNNKSKNINLKIEKRYHNSGFALVYIDNIPKIKKIESRSLDIYHKSLKKKSIVKITNPKNGKYLIAKVKSNKIIFSNFYNSVLSLRIAKELDLNFDDPYVEITLVSKDSTFIAKKAKMFEEEKNVAEKVPIEGIEINDLNVKLVKKKIPKDDKFSYAIKVADFYYEKTALLMIDKIKKETPIKNLRILRLSNIKYRLLIGPFNDIKSLKISFDKMNSLNFENLEIVKDV